MFAQRSESSSGRRGTIAKASMLYDNGSRLAAKSGAREATIATGARGSLQRIVSRIVATGCHKNPDTALR